MASEAFVRELYALDPNFRDFAARGLRAGSVDEVVAKMSPDASAVHVPGSGGPVKRLRKRKTGVKKAYYSTPRQPYNEDPKKPPKKVNPPDPNRPPMTKPVKRLKHTTGKVLKSPVFWGAAAAAAGGLGLGRCLCFFAFGDLGNDIGGILAAGFGGTDLLRQRVALGLDFLRAGLRGAALGIKRNQRLRHRSLARPALQRAVKGIRIFANPFDIEHGGSITRGMVGKGLIWRPYRLSRRV